MTRVVTGGLGFVYLLSLAAAAAAQAPEGRRGGGPGRGAPPPACTTLACDVQADWERTRDLIVGIANAMPEDRYGFKATPAQRSFGEQVMHIVQIDAFLLGALGGKTPRPEINMKATTKTDIMAALRQSFDWGAAVIKEFSDQQLVERVKSPPFLGPMSSRARIYYFSLQHSQDVYGQMVVYLRLNGLVPPASGGV